MAARRSHGTGSLYERADRTGRMSYYGQWHAGGRRHERRIGPKRAEDSREGLTRAQAEAALRRLMAEAQTARTASLGERLDVAEVGRRYLTYAERRGRKASPRKNVESEVGVHLAPFLGTRAMEAIRRADVVDLVGVLERKGLSPKSIRNVIGTLMRCSTSPGRLSAAGRRRTRARA
jgi:hypothetical protein